MFAAIITLPEIENQEHNEVLLINDSPKSEIDEIKDNDRTGKPKGTTNMLKNFCDWLTLGDILVFEHNETNIIYHKCEGNDNINNIRVVYINTDNDPSLMNEDEYPYYLNKYAAICNCSLRQTILLPESVPHAYGFKIPKLYM
jgi:hypothetical protein